MPALDQQAETVATQYFAISSLSAAAAAQVAVPGVCPALLVAAAEDLVEALDQISQAVQELFFRGLTEAHIALLEGLVAAVLEQRAEFLTVLAETVEVALRH